MNRAREPDARKASRESRQAGGRLYRQAGKQIRKSDIQADIWVDKQVRQEGRKTRHEDEAGK